MEIGEDELTDSKRCPLCNGDNKCAIPNGEKPQSCWCMTISISSNLLEKTTEKNRCICQKCVMSNND
jgi:hypothetical protein